MNSHASVHGGAALLLIACHACVSCTAGERGLSASYRGANILLVTVDTLRADRLGFYGYSGISPNLDALAADSFVFESMFTTSSTTFPAHVSLMTGLHPKDSRNGYYLNDSVTTLAEVLSERGYSTRAVVSALPLDARFNLDQGFASYDSDFSSCRGSITTE